MAKVAWALTFLLLAQPAAAFDTSDVMPCFNFLPTDLGIGAEADLLVVLGDQGLVERIDVQRYRPDSEDGRRIAMAAARAVQACGPYVSGRMDAYLTIGPDTPTSGISIITMPERADGLDDSLANDLQKIIEGQ